jgi:hypothetical protein
LQTKVITDNKAGKDKTICLSAESKEKNRDSYEGSKEHATTNVNKASSPAPIVSLYKERHCYQRYDYFEKYPHSFCF